MPAPGIHQSAEIRDDGTSVERDLHETADNARRPEWLDRIAEPRFAFPILLGFGFLIFIVNLGGYPSYTTGEPREAIRIYDLVHGGGFILPTQLGIGLPWKPPLMYWLGALFSIVAGRVNEWTIRLPSATLAIGGILACYFYISRLFDRRSAFVAALILGTSFQYLQSGTAARVDMTLTFCLEVAFFEFITIAEGLSRRRMVLYAAIAAAVLAKGPIGAFLPVMVALIWMAVEGRFSLVRDLKLPAGIALIVVVAGGWYAAASIVGGMAFVRRQILHENLYRLIPSHALQEPHAHGFYWMELALMAGFMPWSLIVPLSVIQYFRAPLNPRLRYLIIWFAAVLVFYNLPQSKRGVYLLALYPSLAALTAIFLSKTFSNPDRAKHLVRFMEIGLGLLLLAAGIGWLLGSLVTLASPPALLTGVLGRFGIHNDAFAPELIAALVRHRDSSFLLTIASAGSGIYLLRSAGVADRLFGGAFAGYCAGVLMAHLVVVPTIANSLTLKHFTLRAMQVVDGRTLGNIGGLDYDVIYYSGRQIPSFDAMGIPDTDYLFCWRRLYDSTSTYFHRRFEVALESGPTNFKGTGRMLLLRRIGPSR